MVKAINRVIYTLGTVEVKGKANMDALLGCILALEKVRDDMKEKDVVEGDAGNKQG